MKEKNIWLFLAVVAVASILVFFSYTAFIVNNLDDREQRIQSSIQFYSLLILIFVSLFVFSLDKNLREISREREKDENKRQLGILDSLYTELDAISSKEREIKILDKKISTKGNLEWVRELFGNDLKPAHGVWGLNPRSYIIGLNSEIEGKKTRDLKSALIYINQKIELIENYLIQYGQIPEKASKIHKEALKKAVMNLLKETIGFIETTKKFIEQEFGAKGN